MGFTLFLVSNTIINEQKSLCRQREYISASKVGINFFNFHFFIFGCAGSLLLCAILSGCAGRLLFIAVCRFLIAEHRLYVCRLSSWGAWAQLPRGTWDLPQSGIEPVSPALGGGFLTTGPPGKSQELI